MSAKKLAAALGAFAAAVENYGANEPRQVWQGSLDEIRFDLIGTPIARSASALVLAAEEEEERDDEGPLPMWLYYPQGKVTHHSIAEWARHAALEVEAEGRLAPKARRLRRALLLFGYQVERHHRSAPKRVWSMSFDELADELDGTPMAAPARKVDLLTGHHDPLWETYPQGRTVRPGAIVAWARLTAREMLDP